MHKLALALTVLGIAFTSAEAQAPQERYVTDALRLEARTGPSTENRIVRMVPSGTRVTVLEEAEGYSRVRLPGDSEAWMLSRYLQDEPAARDRLDEALAELESLRSANRPVTEALDQAREAQRQAEARIRDLEEENQTLSEELGRVKEAAASTLSTMQANERLRAEVQGLERERQELLETKRILERSRERDFFIAGASVLAIGILLGVVLPRIRWKRRQRWNEF